MWKSKIQKANDGGAIDRETIDLVNIMWKEAVGDLEELMECDSKNLLKSLSLETVRSQISKSC